MTQLVSAHELVELLQPVLEHGLIGFDVDGVLAPIVDHADQAQLSSGIAESLSNLSQRASVMILSGRSLESLGRLFDLAPQLRVVGSHGLEVRGAPPIALDAREQIIYDQLKLLGDKTIEAVGGGSWLEFKPASVVVHTREADDEVVEPAVEALINLASMIEGSHVKRGHSVVELLARSASKGDALLGHARDIGRSPLAYLGDDITDEEAFVQMSTSDVSVRVGDGWTAARFRLAGTAEVTKLFALLR